MLRNAAEEFPTEPKILLKYAQALQMWGWHKFGARGTIDETTGVIEYDVQYNSQNIYWQEALRVYEKIIKLNPVNSDKNNAINNLIDLYSTMGEFEKAKNLAESRDSLIISKEILLAIATKGEEKFRYEAEKIILLLGHLNFSIINYIAIRPSVYSSEYGKELILSILKLYEIIFNDDRYGKWHHEIAQLYLRLTLIEISISGSIENALVYFDKAFDHYKEYNRICLEDEYNYTSPLVSNLPKVKKGDLPPTKEDFWKNEVKNYPESLKDELRKIPKYKECFSE